MNKQTFTLYILSFIVISCGSGKLEESQVKQLLEQAKAYPLVVEHRLFCNDTETAKRVHTKGLAELGLVTANLTHTLADIGKPLISFTEKAKPYLLTTSDTLRSIDVQKVKIGEEQFHGVVRIQYTSSGDRALVTYTITVEQVTPFAVMLEKPIEGEQVRETSFTRTERGWEWDKKIVKADPDRKEK